ncbi:cytochrome-c peroxidase [Thiolapillus brandeum]|uniref:Cytochrome c peroxidase n=1 Tax=Thiolapillus brandeum TaxID=1076588 RepID=A0A7U6JHE6_9GAMM|nr:cytochrome-c peroxidase [Thiolapillus brandeum]BAO43717.1 cytochrome c peroxidase [Thiolapillus brandeum]
MRFRELLLTRVFAGLCALNVVRADSVVEPVQPLAPASGLRPEVVSLGKRLFHDPRLSRDNTVSCAHCHKLSLGGVDNMPVSIGIRGQQGGINAPTVFNLNSHIAYFWDGRAPDLESQIQDPLRNPVEMDSDWPEVTRKLKRDPSMQEAFERAFPKEDIGKTTISRALADFMRSLVTLDSPMDRWLRGDKMALTPQQIRGYGLFKDYGCIACHQGAAVGGNMYATMGVMGDYFRNRGKPVTEKDYGRFNVTGLEEDRHVFKVPSLRLVAWTAPYFHDAGADTLEKAITIMGRYQLGREIPPKDVQDIKAFLLGLSGKHPLFRATE